MLKRRVVIAAINLITILVGCQNPAAPSIQSLMAAFQQQAITFTPSRYFFGNTTALFPPEHYPISFLAYERRSDNGQLIDTLLLHSPQSITQTQELEMSIQEYAANPYGLRGIDLAGPLRYYNCSNLIVVYQAMWSTGIDPDVEEVASTHCAPAFVHHPPE